MGSMGCLPCMYSSTVRIWMLTIGKGASRDYNELHLFTVFKLVFDFIHQWQDAFVGVVEGFYYNDAYRILFSILLILQVFIGGDEVIEAISFHCPDEIAILHGIPVLFFDGINVTRLLQAIPKLYRKIFIKQHFVHLETNENSGASQNTLKPLLRAAFLPRESPLKNR